MATKQQRKTPIDSGNPPSAPSSWLMALELRALAKDLPDCVRSVITLGTPFAGSHESNHAWHLYQLVSGRDIQREVEPFDLPGALPVPTISVFSRSDGVVAWAASIQLPYGLQGLIFPDPER